jgi:hypothetical protein
VIWSFGECIQFMIGNSGSQQRPSPLQAVRSKIPDRMQESTVSEPRRILYRGIPMIEGWPEKIEAAQELRSYNLSGRTIPRVPFGSEQDDCGAEKHTCRNCRVLKGELHVPGCDGEECPICGGHLLSCDCEFEILKPR